MRSPFSVAHRLGRAQVIFLTRHLARKAHPWTTRGLYSPKCKDMVPRLIASDLVLTHRHHFNHVKRCSTINQQRVGNGTTSNVIKIKIKINTNKSTLPLLTGPRSPGPRQGIAILRLFSLSRGPEHPKQRPVCCYVSMVVTSTFDLLWPYPT